MQVGFQNEIAYNKTTVFMMRLSPRGERFSDILTGVSKHRISPATQEANENAILVDNWRRSRILREIFLRTSTPVQHSQQNFIMSFYFWQILVPVPVWSVSQIREREIKIVDFYPFYPMYKTLDMIFVL